MKTLRDLFHWVVGRNQQDKENVRRKNEEALNLRMNAKQDLIDIQQEIDDFARTAQAELTHISHKIGVVTRRIAIASGGKKRGL